MMRYPEDPDFAPDEQLYRAINPNYYADGAISSEAIDFPDCSFDRSKYGSPDRLLARFPAWREWGAAALRIGDVPGSIDLSGNHWMGFEIKHSPSARNRAHTMVLCFVDGSGPLTPGSQVSPDAEKKYRIELANRLTIASEPGC